MRQHSMELHEANRQSGDYGKFFIVEMPTPNEPNFYPQCISFTWFRDRELKRAYPEAGTGKLKNGMNWVEYSRTVKYCGEEVTGRPIKEYLDDCGIDINTVPVCKGVWDFYNKIGYDHKKKKYI